MMTKTNRTQSELAVAELRTAQKKIAKALVYVLGLGHTYNGNTLNRLIQEIGAIAESFDDPAKKQITSDTLTAMGVRTYPVNGDYSFDVGDVVKVEDGEASHV
jgi:hypothetical protein